MLKIVTIVLILKLLLIKSYVSIENTIDVNTSSGVVRGQTIRVVNKNVDQFLNIPYAEPPLGRLRFSRPEPLTTPKQVSLYCTYLY